MSILRPNPAPQPVHWSKDYLEHLRTVHLTLVAVPRLTAVESELDWEKGAPE
jgi:hypothetical protein